MLCECLTDSDSEIMSSLISCQLNSNLKSYNPSSSQVKDLSRYHLELDDSTHNIISPKRNRIFSSVDVNSILSLHPISKLFGYFKNPIISDEEQLGYPNVYWRTVRPFSASDVGPVHRDEWFWILNKSFPRPKYPHIRTKVWIPLEVNPFENSLLVSEGSHKRTDINWIGEQRHGIQKPVLRTPLDEIPLKMVPATSGQSLIFHDRLLHGGSLNRGSMTRVSFEFTIISEE